MKQICIFILSFAIIFLVSPLIAQKYQIGPTVGLNMANVDIDVKNDEQDIGTSTRAGLVLGGSIYFTITSNIGLQFEPTYMQKGAKVEVKWMENGTSFKLEQTLKVNYIDIPILFKAYFGQQNIKPYLFAGANIALKTGDIKVRNDKVIVDGQDVTSQVPDDEREIKFKTNLTDFGFNSGAGILFPVGKNNFYFEGQYNIGLTDINNEKDADKAEMKNKGVQIKAGIFFPVGG